MKKPSFFLIILALLLTFEVASIFADPSGPVRLPVYSTGQNTSSGTNTFSGSNAFTGPVNYSGATVSNFPAGAVTLTGSSAVPGITISTGSGTITISGTPTLSGSSINSGSAALSGSASTSGSAAVSGSAVNSGSAAISGSATNSGSSAVSGSAANSGSSANAGAVPWTGVTGTPTMVNLLGGTSGTIALGTNLSITSGTLNAAGGSGTNASSLTTGTLGYGIFPADAVFSGSTQTLSGKTVDSTSFLSPAAGVMPPTLMDGDSLTSSGSNNLTPYMVALGTSAWPGGSGTGTAYIVPSGSTGSVDNSWPTQMMGLPGSTGTFSNVPMMYNVAYSGRNGISPYWNFFLEAYSCSPYVTGVPRVYVDLIGINSITGGSADASPTVLWNTYELPKLVWARQLGYKIILCTIPEPNNFDLSGTLESNLATYNAILLSGTGGQAYSDAQVDVRNLAGIVPTGSVQTSGTWYSTLANMVGGSTIHRNAAGNLIIAKAVQAKLLAMSPLISGTLSITSRNFIYDDSNSQWTVFRCDQSGTGQTTFSAGGGAVGISLNYQTLSSGTTTASNYAERTWAFFGGGPGMLPGFNAYQTKDFATVNWGSRIKFSTVIGQNANPANVYSSLQGSMIIGKSPSSYTLIGPSGTSKCIGYILVGGTAAGQMNIEAVANSGTGLFTGPVIGTLVSSISPTQQTTSSGYNISVASDGAGTLIVNLNGTPYTYPGVAPTTGNFQPGFTADLSITGTSVPASTYIWEYLAPVIEVK